jgi:BMFP domain-containing protein YqiC
MAADMASKHAVGPLGEEHREMSDMIDFDKLDDLARRLSNLVPPALRDSRDEMQENFKAVLQ